MEITLLGTGTPNPSLTRQSSGYLVEIGDQAIVFDHGAGAHHRLMQTGRRAVDIDYLFLSHLHSDHCLDYARLVLTRWDQGAGKIPELKVFGPEYTSRMTDLLFGEQGVFDPDLQARTQYPGSVAVYKERGGELPRQRPRPNVTSLYDGQVVSGKTWNVTVREVSHQQPFLQCYGFRLESEDGVFAYSGDTGPCDAVNALAANADVLVHMCNYISGTALNAGMAKGSSGHLEIAQLAKEQNVSTLVTTHMTPQMDAPGIRERLIGEMAEIFKGTIVWGEDLLQIPITPAPIGKPV